MLFVVNPYQQEHLAEPKRYMHQCPAMGSKFIFKFFYSLEIMGYHLYDMISSQFEVTHFSGTESIEGADIGISNRKKREN